MKRWRNCRKCNGLGIIALSLGAIIILALVLPSCVWWFILAAALIIAGIILLFHR